jgi:hypothetical protein
LLEQCAITVRPLAACEVMRWIAREYGIYLALAILVVARS